MKIKFNIADELAALLKSRYNLNDYANLRTVACHSGTGGCNSFGARLSQMTGKPVKSYLDRVTGNFEADALTKLFRTAENCGIYEEFRATFPLKHTFQIRKKNPFKISLISIFVNIFNSDITFSQNLGYLNGYVADVVADSRGNCYIDFSRNAHGEVIHSSSWECTEAAGRDMFELTEFAKVYTLPIEISCEDNKDSEYPLRSIKLK